MTDHNTLIRSEGCPTCGAEMLWTQNAWHSGGQTRAAYRCISGHLIDPATTKQCPQCGVHDTALLSESDGREQYRCLRCDCRFQVPR